MRESRHSVSVNDVYGKWQRKSILAGFTLWWERQKVNLRKPTIYGRSERKKKSNVTKQTRIKC